MATKTQETAQASPAEITLPEKLDLAFCEAAAPMLDEVKGKPVRLLAQEVTFLGTPGLQFLLAVSRQWQADEKECTLCGMSQAMRDGLALLGYSTSPIKEASEA